MKQRAGWDRRTKQEYPKRSRSLACRCDVSARRFHNESPAQVLPSVEPALMPVPMEGGLKSLLEVGLPCVGHSCNAAVSISSVASLLKWSWLSGEKAQMKQEKGCPEAFTCPILKHGSSARVLFWVAYFDGHVLFLRISECCESTGCKFCSQQD